MKASVYRRPNKPARMRVKERRSPATAAPSRTLPEVVAVDRATECHVTPQEVAARMAFYLGTPVPGQILEPESGTGALVAALLDAGYPAETITAVERHTGLYQAMGQRFQGQSLDLVNDCFLEYAQRAAAEGLRFTRILMNPPFRTARKHIAAAMQLLDDSPGATLVALVPSTFEHPDAEELERLPADTFASAKVWTKIIQVAR